MSAAGKNNDYGWAAAGTVFQQQTQQTQGDLWIQNDGNAGLATVLSDVLTFDNVIVSRQGVLSPPAQTLLRLTTLGNFTIKNGGYVSANGLGYPVAQGPGAGSYNSPNNRGSGGGYGGKGHSVYATDGGSTYGSNTLPTDFGSGGGLVNGVYGASGGGAIRLTVNGTLQVDGSLSANGGDAYLGGSGSGGSLLLRAGLLAGQGGINADGGGATGQGGSGGGGRVALYYVKDTFTGSLTANGANSDFGYADNGTIYQLTTTGNLTVSISLNPTSIGSGQIAYASVNLSDVAPVGGIDVLLSGSNPLATTLPPSVTIPEGQTAAIVVIQASAVTATQTTDITAQLWDQTATTTLTVLPWLSSIKLNPSAALGGTSVTGTITLNLAAPSGGLVVTLTSSSTSVTIPTQITIATGATTGTFTAAVGTISTSGKVTISAAYSQQTLTGSLTVDPSGYSLKSFTVSPASVLAGNSSVGVVVLTKHAPTGGIVVTLTSADSSVTVPATVTVAAGKSSAYFSITTKLVTAAKSVAITATLGTTKSATLSVRLPGVSSLAIVPNLVQGGDNSIGIVALEAASAGPVIVTITSNSSKAVPDITVVIPAGETIGTFNITTSTVTATIKATITAKANNLSKAQALTITP